MITPCPVCGKRTAITWPEFWVYRRGETYYCSENCMIVDETRDLRLMNQVARDRRLRKGENNMANHKLTLEQKNKAVEIFQNGGDHLAWLKKCGAKNPSAAWIYIKQKMEVKNPNLAEKTDKVPDPVGGGEWEKMPKTITDQDVEAKLPEEPVSAGQAMQNMKDAADRFFGQCRDAGLNIPEESSEPATEEPTGFDSLMIKGRRTDAIYSFDHETGMFAISFCGKQLVINEVEVGAFLDELPKAVQQLGVEL